MTNLLSVEELYSMYLACDGKVCTDTRKIESGSLFISLKGEQFNANEFATKAIEAGCGFAIVDEAQYVLHPNIKLVKNGLTALQDLANYHRKQFSIPILAITGSNGKTTNKELIHSVLSKKYNTLATYGNLNNHIGVPLTLLRLKKEHEFAIVEMGANHQGEIADLCKIAEPDFGLITNIGKAHLEGFGGVEGVVKGKSEMYTYLRNKNAIVFLNGDDSLLDKLSKGIKTIRYGTTTTNSIVGEELPSNEKLAFSFTIMDGVNKETSKIQTQLVGSYNLPNFLAAICIGHYFKIPLKDILSALSQYTPNMNRSQWVETTKNKIILDAYNANPNSMQVAIENFTKINSLKKLVILGDMFELGEEANAEHQKVVEFLQANSFTDVVLVGDEFSKLKNTQFTFFQTIKECKSYLSQTSFEGYTILLKGSRGMKMEELKEVL